MSKHMDRLEILCNKLGVKYGDNDELVLQLRQELSGLKEKRAKDSSKRSFPHRPYDKLFAAPRIH